ncbi:hypothetical protein CC99x_010425 [Candidatus Berkiella cookevillensis]|uniref:Uncharacterized protein n=1 Tax=Candidatus Berkiella cookevillensis TaxID=437022 RepID=A0A0Q9YHA0_9GAMM|nr:hypothetical protein [Candidatus Berkiella cookevillensis]MCS5709320.1 hypothetical protein [Candidatus Berkiella cookevillensis]
MISFYNEEAITSIQNDAYNSFSLLDQYDGEIGTCKKMIDLGKFKAEYQNFALVYSRYLHEANQTIVRNEKEYLNYLSEKNYPVVTVYGNAFVVEQKLEQPRLAMLMQYIPGVFIEAKTAAPLNILILAALLGIPARAHQEAWLALNQNHLAANIIQAMDQPQNFSQLQEKANILAKNFQALIQKMEQDQIMICDLQMIISKDGRLTIIDPLDIVDYSSAKSLFKNEIQDPTPDLRQFLQHTKSWLKNALDFCQTIAQSSTPTDLHAFVSVTPKALTFQHDAMTQKKKARSRVEMLRGTETNTPLSSLSITNKM